MKNRAVYGVMLTLLLIGTLSLASDVQSAKAEPGTMHSVDQILFGIEGGNKLVTINSSSGVITDIGSIGFNPVSGLAFLSSGSLFSTHSDPRQPGPQLITINPLTGMGTAVGDVNFDLGSISGLAFDSSNTLFGVTFFGDLVTIDPSTGAITLVGPTGFATTGHIQDIAFDVSGTLFGVTFDPGDPTRGIPDEPFQLITIDPLTGLGTSVGALDPQVVVSGIAFDVSGTLFGVTCDLDPKLVTIDPLRAVVTIVGPLGPSVTCIGDLAYGIEIISVIPTTIDFDPDTLNLRSKGKWITAYVELPEGYDVSDIDVSTVMLNNTIPISLLDVPAPKPVPTEIGDYDEDGIPDLMVRFDRALVQLFICNQGIRYGEVSLTITGELSDGTPFEGTDVIFVNYAGDVNNDGIVNILDAGIVSSHWYPGPPVGPLGYDSNTDFNKDGAVDIFDVGILSINWEHTVP